MGLAKNTVAECDRLKAGQEVAAAVGLLPIPGRGQAAVLPSSGREQSCLWLDSEATYLAGHAWACGHCAARHGHR